MNYHNEVKQNWASLIDSDIINDAKDKLLTSSVIVQMDSTCEHEQTNIENKNILSISEIIAINVEQDNIQQEQILEYQSTVSNQLKKYIKQCKEKKEIFDVDLHMPKLEWLEKTSKYLSTKMKLPNVDHKNKVLDSNSIARSSYKFCDANYECPYNMKFHKCNSQHFVHNFVNADVVSIIKYLKVIEDKTNINNDQLLKCMNTINFVINHMKDELTNISYYSKTVIKRKMDYTNKNKKQCRVF